MHTDHADVHALIALLAGIAVLAAAPLLHAASRGWSRAAAVFDVAVGLATAALVGLVVLPETVATQGGPALAAATAGLLVPTLAERRVRAIAHGAAPWLTALALALHAATDGLALAGVGDEHGHALGAAVILHRMVEGLGLWWLLRPHGRGVAVAGLVLVAGATILGFTLATAIAPVIESGHGALLQAFAGGLVLHLLLHRPVGRAFDRALPWAVAAFFAATAALQIAHHGDIPTALALAGLALVLVRPRLGLLPRAHRGAAAPDPPRACAADERC